MDFGTFIENLKQSVDYENQIVHIERSLPREAEYGELSRPLTPELAEALQRLGISRLYAHQVDAIDALRAGKNVVVETGTASGKTLCYNIPVIEELIKDPESHALYLFPMKALAQDQLRVIRRLSEATGESVNAVLPGEECDRASAPETGSYTTMSPRFPAYATSSSSNISIRVAASLAVACERRLLLLPKT